LGCRECIVSNGNYGDASSLLDVIKGKLAKVMPTQNIQLEFCSPHKALTEMQLPDWKPFQRSSTIVNMVIEWNNNKMRSTNKCMRTYQPAKSYYSNFNTVEIMDTIPTTPNVST
jgi:hypothetical protein